ncbi:MAG: PilZ domain-containing protein [Candidatus Omnitrophota bacterium]
METRIKKRIDIKMAISCSIHNDASQLINLTGGNNFTADAFDISMLGIGFFTKSFLPRDLLLEMDITGIAEDPNKKLRLKGKVCYCKNAPHETKGPNKFKCGVEFLDLSKEDSKQLEQFITKNEQRKAPRLNVNGHKNTE